MPGIADPDTLDYASRLVGDEEASQPSVTRDAKGGRSTTSSPGTRRLLPPEELRCLSREGGPRLRDASAGPARAAAVVGSEVMFVAAAEPGASSKTAEG